jgi:hypothetical protein
MRGKRKREEMQDVLQAMKTANKGKVEKTEA